MTNKQKQKGSNFEREVVDKLEEGIEGSSWKRIPGSGAMGTTLGEGLLMGDVSGDVPGFFRKFRGECKAGYNHSSDKAVKQFTLYKEWLDKIKEEATKTYSFPLLFCKFSGARTGVKSVVVMDMEDFILLMNKYIEITKELDKHG